MRVVDHRPPQSPMPAHLVPIAEKHAPAFANMLTALFADVMAAGAGRDPAELQNDALSMQSHFCAFSMLTLLGNMMECKPDVPIGAAADVIARDVVTRFEAAMQLFFGEFVCRRAGGLH